MLNDRSSFAFAARNAPLGKAARSGRAGPTRRGNGAILTIAARAPDHGTLTPWRFVTVADDQRDALEALLLRALAEQEPERAAGQASEGTRLRSLPGRARRARLGAGAGSQDPGVGAGIVVRRGRDEPDAGGAALGYAPGWVTGWRAYSEAVRRAFCEPGERIAGSSSSAMPAASSRSASGRRWRRCGGHGTRRRRERFPIEFSAIRCIMTA